MPLRIQRRSWKNKDGSETVTWRLVIIDNSGGTRSHSYPDRKQYASYGLNPTDSFETAQEKARIINRSAEFKRRAALKAKIEIRLKEEDLKESAFLPRSIYEAYLKWLQKRRMWEVVPSKTESHLRCMRKLILEVNLSPSKWSESPEEIYFWFKKKKHSLSYIDKVLPLLNEYGYFYCREMSQPFLAVPTPKGGIKEKLENANLEHREGRQEESRPLTEALLENLTKLQHVEQYNWMRLSLYFGLRPKEVDVLGKVNDKAWFVSQDDRGTYILHVFQSKLTGINPKRRWKLIPAILPAQQQLIKELLEGIKVDRPIVKTLHHHLGEGYGVYAGRKGFEDLMRKYRQKDINIKIWKGNQDLRPSDKEDDSRHPNEFKKISQWLGHKDLSRTGKNYRNPEAADYDPIA